MLGKIINWFKAKKQEIADEEKRSNCPNCGADAEPLYINGKKSKVYHCWNCGQEYMGML